MLNISHINLKVTTEDNLVLEITCIREYIHFKPGLKNILEIFEL